MTIFLDLETTGLENSDKICSIAIIGIEGNEKYAIYELVNEKKKISAKASSINYITNEMLEGKKTFLESVSFSFLQKYNEPNSALIVHNVQFDLKMLQNSGILWQGEIIDTLRCTKHLISECESFSLQFLRYELKLYKKEAQEMQNYFGTQNVCPHSAISDVVALKLLYESLLEIEPKEKLIELSSKNVLLQKFEFGKYRGRYIEEISMYDRSYLEWILKNIDDLDEDLIYTIQRYLKK